VAAVRDGKWLTRERIRAYPRIFLGIFLAGLLWFVVSPTGPRWRALDFVGFWVPANLAALGRATAIYDHHLAATLQQAISGRSDEYVPWVYPPTFLLLILPLGVLPYMVAFVAYVTAGLIVYWVALRKLAGSEGRMLAFAFPGVIICLCNGHAEFLIAGLFGGALLLLDRRPYIAGLLIGLCSVKPHLFLMVPVALVAGGYWRSICSAALLVLLGAAISVAVFGVEVWRDFFLTASGLGGGIGHNGASFETVLAKQQSAFAFGSRLGGPILAATVQVATMVVAAWAVAITWARDRPLVDRACVLCCGTLLASPYLFDYDLVILAVPIALLARDGLAQGFPPWRKSLLCALWIAPALARTCSIYGGLPATVILLGLCVAHCIANSYPTGVVAHQSH
jgi:alpha-1,2-mannosyltransferase